VLVLSAAFAGAFAGYRKRLFLHRLKGEQ